MLPQTRPSLTLFSFFNMLKGEGEAMAIFAESGQRIPRRGEIGLDSNTIEQFETSGYVMSGSRHKVMNAVRMRKENQVINEQEKRAILRLQKEEKQRKEAMILSQVREVLVSGKGGWDCADGVDSSRKCWTKGSVKGRRGMYRTSDMGMSGYVLESRQQRPVDRPCDGKAF